MVDAQGPISNKFGYPCTWLRLSKHQSLPSSYIPLKLPPWDAPLVQLALASFFWNSRTGQDFNPKTDLI